MPVSSTVDSVSKGTGLSSANARKQRILEERIRFFGARQRIAYDCLCALMLKYVDPQDYGEEVNPQNPLVKHIILRKPDE